jgi:hypothetical protein
MQLRPAILLVLLLQCFGLFSQHDSLLTIAFDFNEHNYEEKHHQIQARPVGVSLVRDRFGNERSAVFIHGHASSYLSLGTSPLLKTEPVTVSLWIKLARRVYSGRGYECNPILLLKNGPGDDFNCAYVISYDAYTNRIGAGSSKNSLQEVLVGASEDMRFGEWQHLVFTSDTNYFAFYVNGELQGRFKKGFKTPFLATDSLMFGHTANKKNDRFSQGIFDDIRIFHRVMSEREILDLYHEPNPNRAWVVFITILKYLGIAAGIFAAAFLLVWQRRKALKREQEKLELNNRLYEMEIRTLKAQMNPHFIFNSLNSIQQFILGKDNDKAGLYLAKFSKLLRKLLESNSSDSLSVGDEVEILNRYIEIEALRFSHAFTCTMEVSPVIDQASTMIPHLLIQPFIENAIWHGLLPKKEEKQLMVRFDQKDPRTLTCTIEDNGIGRQASQQQPDTFRKKSLGLSFVKHRLELLSKTLGSAYGVEITDKTNEKGEGAGTKVVVTLPVLKTS